MSRSRWYVWGFVILVMGLGCSLAPRHFRAINDPSPINRARAMGLGQNLPPEVVIPALIERLDDPDPVVRLSAHERLKAQTGEDFGFLPWSDDEDRARAGARWRSWWAAHQAGLVNSGRIP